MKTEISILERLLKGAAQETSTVSMKPPFGFETRVLTCWKNRLHEEDITFLLPILRRGLLAAGVILFLTALVSFSTLNRPGDEELVLVNSTLELVMK